MTKRFVGLLHSGSQHSFVDQVKALKRELAPDVEVIEKYAENIDSNLKKFADDLVQQAIVAGPNNFVLVAAGGPAPALLLQDKTIDLPDPKPPIVFTTVVTPDELGLVATLDTPTYNLTGMAGHTSELDPERLHMLFELAEAPKKINKGDKIGVLVSNFRPEKGKQVNKVKYKAGGLKLTIEPKDVKDVKDLNEIEKAFVDFKKHVKGVVVMADSLFNDLRPDVVKIANASGLPTIYQWKEFVDVGGLISFGPDIFEAYGKAGEYVMRILGGESPSEMKCSEPSGFKVYVNGLTAKNQGMTPIPKTLLGNPVNVI